MNNLEMIKVLERMAQYKICSIAGNIDEIVYYIDNGNCILDDTNVLITITNVDGSIKVNSIAESFINSNMDELFIAQIKELQSINDIMFKSKKIDSLLRLAKDEVASAGEKRNCINLANNIIIKLYEAI